MFFLNNLHVISYAEFVAVFKAQLRPYGQRSGIYTLSLMKGPDRPHEMEPIGRLTGHDDEGRLYIGRSGELETRLPLLFSSLKVKGRPHRVGEFWHKHHAVQERCPIDRLKIIVEPGRDPIKLENTALQGYVDQFGECPPLNVRVEKQRVARFRFD